MAGNCDRLKIHALFERHGLPASSTGGGTSVEVIRRIPAILCAYSYEARRKPTNLIFKMPSLNRLGQSYTVHG